MRKMWNMLIHHLFIFSQEFILVRVAVESDPILGTLGTTQLGQDLPVYHSGEYVVFSSILKTITMQIYSCSSENTSFGNEWTYITISH